MLIVAGVQTSLSKSDKPDEFLSTNGVIYSAERNRTKLLSGFFVQRISVQSGLD